LNESGFFKGNIDHVRIWIINPQISLRPDSKYRLIRRNFF